MSEAVKTVNYTPEMVEIMTEKYTQDPSEGTVEDLANDLGKTKRSIISKLSSLNLYVRKEKVTKAGKPIVKKSELVIQVAEALGLEGLESLEKANKADLEKLVAAFERFDISEK